MSNPCEEINLAYNPVEVAHCAWSPYGLHSMYGYDNADHDSYGRVRPTVCSHCGNLCRFNFQCLWWELIPTYTIPEEPG
jgi:hypothetical protein